MNAAVEEILPSGEILGCRDCGVMQTLPPMRGRDLFLCVTCDSELERRTGRRMDVALAFSATTLLLLLPANLLPFLTTAVLGATRQSYLFSSATWMWRLDWPLLATIVALVIIILPLVRFSLLTLVLASLRLGYRPSWLGRVFRLTDTLKIWAMPDVFLLSLWVAYARLSATVATHLEIGAYCMIGAGITTLLTRATLDQTMVWRAIGQDDFVPRTHDVIACPACELIVDRREEGHPCPRCGTGLSERRSGSLAIAVALTLAGILLYVPANLYPMATIPIGLTPTSYTVLGGVIDLVNAHLIGLALLVFTASFAIPFIKLVGIGWCIASVLGRSTRLLRTKTRVYRVVEEIGRWSMVDPLVIACFVPVTQFSAQISSRADTAAPFFTCVVVLTMLAARMFDPRLMWDAKRIKTA